LYAIYQLGTTQTPFLGSKIWPFEHVGALHFGGVPVKPRGHVGALQFGGVPV
jgi:hypothetical protein